MNSKQLLTKLFELLETFSKKLPDDSIQIKTNIKDEVLPQNNLSENILQLSRDLQELAHEKLSTSTATVDSKNVQITVSKSQLEQRINAFISHAQNAVDQQNIQEFFPIIKSETVEDGCARTNAVYRRRPTRGTHVQVNRIKNQDGPQTQFNSQGRWRAVKREKNLDTQQCPESVQERLENLEGHIRMNKSTAPKDVYTRLKFLEDKVLELESISPEYFRDKSEQRSSPTAAKQSNDQQQMSIDQIDDRIRFLKNKLLCKKRKIG